MRSPAARCVTARGRGVQGTDTRGMRGSVVNHAGRRAELGAHINRMVLAVEVGMEPCCPVAPWGFSLSAWFRAGRRTKRCEDENNEWNGRGEEGKWGSVNCHRMMPSASEPLFRTTSLWLRLATEGGVGENGDPTAVATRHARNGVARVTWHDGTCCSLLQTRVSGGSAHLRSTQEWKCRLWSCRSWRSVRARQTCRASLECACEQIVELMSLCCDGRTRVRRLCAWHFDARSFFGAGRGFGAQDGDRASQG